MKQERVRKKIQPKSKRRDEETQEIIESRAVKRDDLIEKIDELLTDIDSVLEENAEEMVKNYVQKGGE